MVSRRRGGARAGCPHALLALALSLPVAALAACSTKYAETAQLPATAGAGGASGAGGGTSGGGAGGDPCPTTLAERLTVTTVPLDTAIRYKHQGYDLFPTDERLALAASPGGALHVAWLENAGTRVRVTPLSPEGSRSGEDVVLAGFDVGGLVAHDDGFMLLTRRDDPGEPLADPNHDGAIAAAALLVRVRDGVEAHAAPLTGTSSVVQDSPPDHRRDCAPVWLNGRLAFNGEKYGAYFQVHGCEGSYMESFYGDKLVYTGDDGAFVPGGWDWNCSINQGIRLLPEAGAFTALCLADSLPFPGLNWVKEGTEPVQLAPELTAVGYCAGQFGSVVKMGDGSYVVGWLSRGLETAGGERQAEKPATDVAIRRVGPGGEPFGPLVWVVETPSFAETNLHVAAYGSDRLLLVWDRVEDITCSTWTCFGSYAGTYARLVDVSGFAQTPDERLPAPPSADDIVVLPNGDLAWAFVPDPERDYAAPLRLDAGGVPLAPERSELAIARLRQCR